MFLRIMGKSFSKRKGKIFIAVLAIMMGAAIPSAMITVSMDITDKVSHEFRKYGANLILVPHSDTIEVGFPGVEFGSVTEQKYINETDLWKIKTISWRNNILGFSPFLYQVVRAGEGDEVQNLVLAGTYFNKEINITAPYSSKDPSTFRTGLEKISPWWNVRGEWIDDSDDSRASMVGKNVAKILGLELNDVFTIKYSERPDDVGNETSHELKVVGIVDSEGYEDNQILVNLQVAQNITSRQDKIHIVQVSALCNDCPVETFSNEIEEKLPYVDGRSVKQLVNAEMNVLGKIEQMMFLVTIVALLASGLGVSATMTSSVVERQKEIGLMKSIGAENKKIALLFLTEATIVGALGGAIGYVVGLVLAQFVGKSAFDSFITPQLLVFPIVLIISISITLVAATFPVRRAIGIEPIRVLRGD